MDTPERDIILKAITEEEKQLVKFEHERNQALSRINTLKQKLASLNAIPFSWKGTIVQYAGRLHRVHPGKQEVRVYDYVDAKVLKLARMHKKRLKKFQIIGYTID